MRVPYFYVVKRRGWRALFSSQPFAIVAEVEGKAKQVALTHSFDVGDMVATGLNQWNGLQKDIAAAQVKAEEAEQRIHTL